MSAVANVGKRLDFIDGLRALAIVAVIGFHTGTPGFSGGFAGVDIFFVISGFVIGGQIVNQMEQKRFSARTFYAQRVLRILPPLFIVLIAGALAMSLLPVLPSQIAITAAPGAASAAMLSNHYFLIHSGYFDPDSVGQPFLHTWSLAVEEQYYLCIPLILLLLYAIAALADQSARAVICGDMRGADRVVSVDVAAAGHQFAFYGMPARIWEFMAGALALLIRRDRQASDRLAALATFGGLLCCVAAIPLLSDGSIFPEMLTPLPVIGAGLVLWGGSCNPRSTAARLLALPPGWHRACLLRMVFVALGGVGLSACGRPS